VAAAWGQAGQAAVLNEVYPTLRKVSVDFAVMEPASRDANFRVAAVPMPLEWLDIGSWPMFAETCRRDEQGNALAAQRDVLVDSQRTLVASSDPGHLIAAIGCEDMLIIHTPDATLVCRADRAEEIKKVYGLVGERFGEEYL
jgi:mannose-1-phosphate guanylyltransferase